MTIENKSKYGGVSSDMAAKGNTSFITNSGGFGNESSSFYNDHKMYPGNTSATKPFNKYEGYSSESQPNFKTHTSQTTEPHHSSPKSSPAIIEKPKVIEQNLLDFDVVPANSLSHNGLASKSKVIEFANFATFQSPAPQQPSSTFNNNDDGFGEFTCFSGASEIPKPQHNVNDDFGDFTGFISAPVQPSITSSSAMPFNAFPSISKPAVSIPLQLGQHFEKLPLSQKQFAPVPVVTNKPNTCDFGAFTSADNGTTNLMHSPPKTSAAVPTDTNKDPFLQLVSLDAMSLSGAGKKDTSSGPSLNMLGGNNMGYRPPNIFH